LNVEGRRLAGPVRGFGQMWQIDALVRASDPFYELVMRLGMSKREDEFWRATLKNVAAHFGAAGQPTHRAVLIDPRLRWREAKNIWHNAAIRTVLYALAAPFMGFKKIANDNGVWNYEG
jgi:hypothetical protein